MLHINVQELVDGLAVQGTATAFVLVFVYYWDFLLLRLVYRVELLLFVLAHSFEFQVSLLIELFKDACVLVAGPEKVLHNLWERKIDDGFEQVVHEYFSLNSICSAPDPELSNDVVNDDLAFFTAIFQFIL